MAVIAVSAGADPLRDAVARWGRSVDEQSWLFRGPPDISSVTGSATASVTGSVTGSAGPGPLVARVDGAACRTASEALTALAVGLDFPRYYGMNADAFEESLSDLLTRTDTVALGGAFGDRDGVPAEAVLVLVDNAGEFLADSDPEDRAFFYRVVGHSLDADAVSSPYRDDPTCRRAGFFVALLDPVG